MPDLPGRCVGRPPGVDPLCRRRWQPRLRPPLVSDILPAQLLAQRAPGEPSGPGAAGFPGPVADGVALLGPSSTGSGSGEPGGRAVRAGTVRHRRRAVQPGGARRLRLRPVSRRRNAGDLPAGRRHHRSGGLLSVLPAFWSWPGKRCDSTATGIWYCAVISRSLVPPRHSYQRRFLSEVGVPQRRRGAHPLSFAGHPRGISMYDDSITTIGAAELLNARLAQAEASLRGTPVVTREDLLSTVYSALNAVLALGNNVTPLLPVAREGPAIAGDLNGNFQILNQDAQAIIRQLIGTENDAATLFNLFASTQNNLRQTVRQVIYIRIAPLL